MKKPERKHYIHGINIDSLLKELWHIQMIQYMNSPDSFTWTEMFICNHITEEFGIRNENSQFYSIIETFFYENPLAPPSINDILKECENKGLMEVENGD